MIYFMIHILLLVPTLLIIRRIVAEWRAADTPRKTASLPIIYHAPRHEPLTFANQNDQAEFKKIIFTNKIGSGIGLYNQTDKNALLKMGA